ncbi:hypothetical protein [Streptomyces sp. NPDC006645]|uniref:hypothetical protein n=1 Tax=unclassified Streptomyces TaxID=2593676 RepID=UPI0033A8A5A5
MDEEFDLNTYAGRRGHMEAAIERALERRRDNIPSAAQYEHVLDYSRNRQLAEARDSEAADLARYGRRVAQTDAFGADLELEYENGTMDRNNSAYSEGRYATHFQRMEEAGYAYAGSINLHEQRIEGLVTNERLRQENLRAQLQRPPSLGERSGQTARDLLPTVSQRRGASYQEDQRSRGTKHRRHHHGNKH